MTTNLIVAAMSTLRRPREASVRPRSRARRGPMCLETLEHRVSLSSCQIGATAQFDLNPQPLPPGYAHVDPW